MLIYFIKIIRTGKLEDLTTEELESRMKKIIDDYSPILEDVPFEELSQKVREKTEPQKVEPVSQSKDTESYLHNESQEDSLHLSDTADGEDVPVGE